MKIALVVLFTSFNLIAQTQLDRFQGSVLGTYLGDALGKGVEYVYHNAPATAPASYRFRKINQLAERSGVKRHPALGSESSA